MGNLEGRTAIVSGAGRGIGRAIAVKLAGEGARVVGLTRTLAKEWGRYAVNVNAVAFGLIRTRLTEAAAAEAAQPSRCRAAPSK
ncbi:SDR family oxidoreductase [Streptomyces chiangmaiensis]